MKRTLQLLLLAVVATCFFACKKELTKPNIVGTWELRDMFGPSGDLSYAAGNGNTYTFNADGTFSQQAGTNGQITQGTYSIKLNAEKVNDEEYNELLLNGASSGQAIQVQDSLLSLGLAANNGSGSLYAKIK